MEMEIKEFANGSFQVWKDDDQVLRPCNLEWMGSHQSQHNFMYFSSIKKAQKAIASVLNKEKVTAVHKVEITETREIK